MTHTTSGNTYQIDLCLTMDEKEGAKKLCGTYLFRMPFLSDIDPTNEWGDLVLLEKAPLFDHQSIVVYYPPNFSLNTRLAASFPAAIPIASKCIAVSSFFSFSSIM